MENLSFASLLPLATDSALILGQKVPVTWKSISAVAHAPGSGFSGEEWDTDAVAPTFDTDAAARVKDTDTP